LNRTRIEWCDFTWNPITGCTRGCTDTNGRPYCYARRMAYRLRGRAGYPQDEPFRPTFHPDRLEEPYETKSSAKIFVCSMGEMFDPGVRSSWVDQVLAEMRNAPWHTYQILTKQASRVKEFHFPEYVWLGCSQDGRTTNIADIEHILYAESPGIRFVSFEPLLGPIERIPEVPLYAIDWFIIGAQTGPGAAPPKKEWVQDIIDMAHGAGAPVFLKDNLHWPETVKEYPKEAEEK